LIQTAYIQIQVEQTFRGFEMLYVACHVLVNSIRYLSITDSEVQNENLHIFIIALIMEALNISEKPVNFYEIVRRNIFRRQASLY
jgi:hypothetical protein